MKITTKFFIYIFFTIILSCKSITYGDSFHFVSGGEGIESKDIWLTHEHILVDFIGADRIDSDYWDHEEVINEMLPYLIELKSFGVSVFVDATPQFLGRDVMLLQQLSNLADIKIMTNTGLYAAVDNKYIPNYAYDSSAKELAQTWISEFENGIEGSEIRPGFIKISVNDTIALRGIDAKVVRAAAITHRATGMTIGSHTGPARALWPQLNVLKTEGVSPNAFIWIHAQNEDDHTSYIKAANMGCWISLDGIGWDIDKHLQKLVFAKENDILDHVLISHDAGWYDPQKQDQDIKPYTNIFELLIPKLRDSGFTDDDLNMILSVNPAKAFAIGKRLVK